MGWLGQCMEEGHHKGCSGGPCSPFCNGCMVPGQAEGELYMQACNYSFLKDAIVHLNIKHRLWFWSEIFVGFHKTTTNKQSKQQQKSDTFQAGFFFSFFFCKVMWRLVLCDSVFKGRTFLKWSTSLFIPYS